MKIRYDDEIDAAYISISNKERYKTIEYSGNSNIIIDYDLHGEITGIEVLNFLNSFEEVLLFLNSTVFSDQPKFDLESLFLDEDIESPSADYEYVLAA